MVLICVVCGLVWRLWSLRRPTLFSFFFFFVVVGDFFVDHPRCPPSKGSVRRVSNDPGPQRKNTFNLLVSFSFLSLLCFTFCCF